MSEPILTTKFYLPTPRSSVVLRSRLIDRLNEGLLASHKLTLICAPAGFGKTTLVSEWITEGNRPAAWLSLDEGDNDPIRFLVYFIAAIQTIRPAFGAALMSTLQSPQPTFSQTILSLLIDEVAAVADSFIFVFDDYHTIDSKPVEKALAFLIEHLPPQIRLVIITREDPDIPLARLRARDQLTELRGADLQFTEDEAAEFLNRVMRLDLSPEDISALETRTEGWIAGLQLAALSMQGRPNNTSFIHSFTGSNRFVLDYLVEEVLHQQTEFIQEFLLRTSVLERMCGELCEAVLCTPSGSGQETLEYLENANLFIIPLDNERRWYRYHHLFSDLLRHRLFQNDSLTKEFNEMGTGEPMDEQALNLRASLWFERQGSTSEAIHHALASKDFERAANLIELVVPEMRRNRQGTTITELGWMKVLPDELVRFRPVLSVAYGYALFGGGEIEGVEKRLQDAERWLNLLANQNEEKDYRPAEMIVVDEAGFRRLPGMIALLRTAQALAKNDMAETVKNARRVLELAPKDDFLTLGGAASTLGLATWASGDLVAARSLINDGLEYVRKAGYISPAIGNALTLADIQIAQGCLHEAMATYERGLLLGTVPGAPFLRGSADMHVGMSELYREFNNPNKAMEHLVASQSLGELAGLPQNPYRWCAAMGRLLVNQGKLDDALEQLDRAEQLYEPNFSPNVRPLSTRKVRVWVLQGRLEEALGWARAQKISVNDDLSYLREYDHITLARILLACHRMDYAQGSITNLLRLLDRLLAAAKERGGNGSVIEILMIQALAYQTSGNLPAALMALQSALELAEPHGYLRIFLDEGSSMMELLREAGARGIMPDYSRKLLSASDSEKNRNDVKIGFTSSHVVIPQDIDPLIEPLSQRELEVLKLLRSDLSGPEIAEKLCVSINTFRTHTKNIFIKLGVNDRRAAIRRTIDLKLF